MIFGSDNWSGAAPQINQALGEHSHGMNVAYGIGDLDQKIYDKFSEVFETDVTVMYVATGSAANSISHAMCAGPGGVSFCHSEAHIVEDECGAPEFLSGGGRLCRVNGDDGKIDPANLTAAISRYPAAFNHQGRASMVSITQATEIGTVYECEEISRISEICKSNNLPLHMDGARFANGMVHLGVTPAEMTWKSGVDLVSFGGTKNGCWCAEALIIFDPELARDAEFLRKRSGHLFSKSRFVSAQFGAYFKDDLWRELATHSNAMAMQLREGIKASSQVRLAWESAANMAFFIASQDQANALAQKGARFHPIMTPGAFAGKLESDERIYRLVTSFATTKDDVQRFLDLV